MGLASPTEHRTQVARPFSGAVRRKTGAWQWRRVRAMRARHAYPTSGGRRVGRRAGVTGVEPAASGFGDRRSDQLSYTPSVCAEPPTLRKRGATRYSGAPLRSDSFASGRISSSRGPQKAAHGGPSCRGVRPVRHRMVSVSGQHSSSGTVGGHLRPAQPCLTHRQGSSRTKPAGSQVFPVARLDRSNVRTR